MNKKNYRELEHIKERGTKRYRERLIQEEEAEQEIKEFDREEPVEEKELDINIDKQ